MMVDNWTSSDTEILDKQTLDTLIGLFGDEGPEAISSLIDEYFTELSAALAQMEQAIIQQDGNNLYVLAHTLKSSSANMGAASISAIAKQIEAAARVGEWNFAISQFE